MVAFPASRDNSRVRILVARTNGLPTYWPVSRLPLKDRKAEPDLQVGFLEHAAKAFGPSLTLKAHLALAKRKLLGTSDPHLLGRPCLDFALAVDAAIKVLYEKAAFLPIGQSRSVQIKAFPDLSSDHTEPGSKFVNKTELGFTVDERRSRVKEIWVQGRRIDLAE